MTDCIAFRIVLNNQQLTNTAINTGLSDGCTLPEVHFPCMGKCYSKSNSIIGAVYKNTCPYCSVWTSLPDGASLEITYIFECSLLGYGKRIKE